MVIPPCNEVPFTRFPLGPFLLILMFRGPGKTHVLSDMLVVPVGKDRWAAFSSNPPSPLMSSIEWKRNKNYCEKQRKDITGSFIPRF